MRIFLFALACVTALSPISQPGTWVQESNAPNATDEVRQVTRELLRRREYAIALYFLQSLADDPAHAANAEMVRADIEAISGLQKFSETVEIGIQSLREGDEVSDRNNKYIFQRYEENYEGTLLLLIAESGEERRLKCRQLHSLTWLDLANRDENQKPDNLTVGLFLAFDKDADLEAARAKLDEAARSGQDVTRWLERASEVVDHKTDEQAPQTGAEPLVGKWFLVIGKRRLAFVVDFFENGQGNAFVENWENGDDGYYRVEFSRRGPARVFVIGDRFFGRLATGEMVRGWH